MKLSGAEWSRPVAHRLGPLYVRPMAESPAVGVRIPDITKRTLRAVATGRDQTLASLIREAITHYFDCPRAPVSADLPPGGSLNDNVGKYRTSNGS